MGRTAVADFHYSQTSLNGKHQRKRKGKIKAAGPRKKGQKNRHFIIKKLVFAKVSNEKETSEKKTRQN